MTVDLSTWNSPVISSIVLYLQFLSMTSLILRIPCSMYILCILSDTWNCKPTFPRLLSTQCHAMRRGSACHFSGAWSRVCGLFAHCTRISYALSTQCVAKKWVALARIDTHWYVMARIVHVMFTYSLSNAQSNDFFIFWNDNMSESNAFSKSIAIIIPWFCFLLVSSTYQQHI